MSRLREIFEFKPVHGVRIKPWQINTFVALWSIVTPVAIAFFAGPSPLMVAYLLLTALIDRKLTHRYIHGNLIELRLISVLFSIGVFMLFFGASALFLIPSTIPESDRLAVASVMLGAILGWIVIIGTVLSLRLKKVAAGKIVNDTRIDKAFSHNERSGLRKFGRGLTIFYGVIITLIGVSGIISELQAPFGPYRFISVFFWIVLLTSWWLIINRKQFGQAWMWQIAAVLAVPSDLFYNFVVVPNAGQQYIVPPIETAVGFAVLLPLYVGLAYYSFYILPKLSIKKFADD